MGYRRRSSPKDNDSATHGPGTDYQEAVVKLNAVAERRNVVHVVRRKQRRGIIENGVSSSHTRLSIPKRIPGKANPRRPVVPIRFGNALADGSAAGSASPWYSKTRQGRSERFSTHARFIISDVERLIAIPGIREEGIRFIAHAKARGQA